MPPWNNVTCDYDTDKYQQKVTIILVISFQTSSKKAVRDPYNPICRIVKKFTVYSNRKLLSKVE